jgi:hypothetical protein
MDYLRSRGTPFPDFMARWPRLLVVKGDYMADETKNGLIALLAVAIQIRDGKSTSIDQAVDMAQTFLETVNQKIAEEGQD